MSNTANIPAPALPGQLPVAGTAYGLGIGPGEPDLITLKAYNILQKADVIAYPALEDGASLARQIIAPHLAGNSQNDRIEIAIRITMGEPADPIYDQAALEIGEHLKAGKSVAVLCEGDPFFYGSFMYLFGRLAEAGHPVQTVPGVSSMMACAAQLGAPLAAKNDVLQVIPGPLSEDRLRAQLGNTDAAAIIKLGRHFPKVRKVIEELGLTDRARYIERATLETQKMIPLGDLPIDATAPYFSMILIHRRGDAWR
ncbi:precorrin-2 C(20)-methyltransferase [Thalassospira alkalitolerans]|uniref:precorrin-2 C(20)-methyltransferase n=1 Tax=Thalassospira alkalitolerans TaxID=1293890 RepID=UPI000A1DD4A8|nr:precorrin-2 C(20)-methyltransferase [Thalassospira alkalitolerans]|tara:strand:+ start:54812 stop:55576 length:765 start_codon:yes stop_codon:yes gene_type:complete